MSTSDLRKAQTLLLAEARGKSLTPVEQRFVAQAVHMYGPEQIFMDGELFA